MAEDTRDLKWRIYLDTNPEVLDDLTQKFREAEKAKEEFAVSSSLGLSINLWDLAFEQIRRLPAAIADAAKRAEEMAMRLSSARRELEQFSGGAGMAAQRLDELVQLADHPNWELPGLVKGASSLDKLTNGALSSGKGLQLVADVATGTGNAFDGLSVHVGNAYKMLMAGANASGPLQALVQMGAISAETQAELEALQKTGAKGPEVWAVLEASLSKFNGELDRMRNTAEGSRARIDNLMSQALGTAAQAYLDRTQESVESLADTLERMDTASLEHLANQIGVVGAGLNNAKEFVVRFNAEFIAFGKMVAAVGLLAAAKKALAFAAGLRDMMRASAAFSAALAQATIKTQASRIDLMAHVQAQTQSTAASTRAAAAKQADTVATTANTAATTANTAAKVANARASGAAATASGAASVASALPGAAAQAGKAAQSIPAATANVGRLTTAFRGLGGAIAGVGRGLTALVGGPLGLVMVAAVGVKALTDYLVDKHAERLDRIDKEQNALVTQNAELSAQLHAMTSIAELNKLQQDTHSQLYDLAQKKKDASEDEKKLIEQLEHIARGRLELIKKEGAEIVAKNAALKIATAEEERRNAALALRAEHYRKNREQLDSDIDKMGFDLVSDPEKIAQIEKRNSELAKGYYSTGGDLQPEFIRLEIARLQANRSKLDLGSDEDIAALDIQIVKLKELYTNLQELDRVRDRIAATEQATADRAFALDQMREQLRADQARLAGNDALADSIERQARLKRDIREIVAQTGVDEQKAEALAKSRLGTEEAITRQKEAQRRRRELEDMLAQYAIDQARLAGNEKLASQWEDELRIKRDIRDIVERTGKSEQWASAFAKDRLDTEKKLAAQKAAGDGKGVKGGEMQPTVKTDIRGTRLHFVDGEWLRREDMSHAQRRATGTASYVRDGAAAVGMNPGWLDLGEDRMLRRNDFLPGPASLSATLASQLGVGAQTAAPSAFPAADAAPFGSSDGANGEKITTAAEGAAGRLEIVEEKTAAAIEQLGQILSGRFDQISGEITSINARIDDLYNN